MATTLPSSRETEATVVERYTQSGRRLWYQLKVIQQPERARACGSGPKSSADRRPVDPPPVVELQIFEGPSIAEGKDITFNYNANFFLYTTLELARPIVHGRLATPAAFSPPVLTGMPVAAMAYLDRPKEAGYFLFPDLSVRHEGRYRLSFALYEETKEEPDFDVNQRKEDGPCFIFRTDVKSVAFSVYSAKKFPGLTESTALSRTVAEQGCRVRIRRDVRMRRRDGKTGNDYEEDEFSRSRRTQTPENQAAAQAAAAAEAYNRARSLSNSSVDRAAYPGEPQRRPSSGELPQSPFSTTSQPPPGGYLAFGNKGSHPPAPQFAAPAPLKPLQSSPLPSPTVAQTPYAGQNQERDLRRSSGNFAPPQPPTPQQSAPPHQPPTPQQQAPPMQPQQSPAMLVPRPVEEDSQLPPLNLSPTKSSAPINGSNSCTLPPFSFLARIVEDKQSRQEPQSQQQHASQLEKYRTLAPAPEPAQLLPRPPAFGSAPQQQQQLSYQPTQQYLPYQQQPARLGGSKRSYDESFTSHPQRLSDGARQVDPHHNAAGSYAGGTGVRPPHRNPYEVDHDTPNQQVLQVWYPRADSSISSHQLEPATYY